MWMGRMSRSNRSPFTTRFPPTRLQHSSRSHHSSLLLSLVKLFLHSLFHLRPLSSTRTAHPSYPNPSSFSHIKRFSLIFFRSCTRTPALNFHHVHYHAQVDEHHEASGPGLLACLVLRNLTRAAKFALESTTSSSTDGSSKATEVAGGGRVSVAN